MYLTSYQWLACICNFWLIFVLETTKAGKFTSLLSSFHVQQKSEKCIEYNVSRVCLIVCC